MNAIVPKTAFAPVSTVEAGLEADDPRRGAVIALGNFDGFHVGHLYLLETARDMAGDAPFAAMSCEPHPVSLFRPQSPRFRIASATQKAWRAAEIGLSYLFQPRFDPAFAALTPEAFLHDTLIEGLGVKGIVVGEDFCFGRDRAGDTGFLETHCARSGIELRVVKKLPGYSSTRVRQAIQRGDLDAAADMLGRPWHAEVTFDGCHMQIEASQILPPPGQYILRKRATGEVISSHLDAEGALHGPVTIEPGSASWAFLRLIASAA